MNAYSRHKQADMPLFEEAGVLSPATIQERFEAFLARRPEVYGKLVELAREAKRRGHQRYSIDALIQVYRWNCEGAFDEVEGFKLSDHFSSRLARKVMDENPDLQGFFELRRIRTQ